MKDDESMESAAAASTLVSGFLKKKKTRDYEIDREAIATMVQGRVLFQEPLARYVTMRVGGPADALIFPKDLPDLKEILAYAEHHKIPVFMLGGGSNLLIRDGGLRGFVICLREGFAEVEALGLQDGAVHLRAQAGASLPRLVRQSVQQGQAGLEGLAGVVGTVGGAVVGNSGTRHGTMGDVLVSLTAVNRAGQQKTFAKEKLHFEYRSMDLDRSWYVIEAEIKLHTADPAAVQEKLKTYLDYRQKTQPLSYPNAGSIFKNPKGEAAGELIERHGLKGVRLRGAKISELHGNWIVNLGDASAQDVLQLIELIQDKINDMEGIVLEPEIRIVGEKSPN